MSQNEHHTTTSHRTIFLAEDDIDDQDFLKEALQAIDPAIQLFSFSSGLKFMNHLSNTPDGGLPCLIVLDYNIPEINGAEILQQLQKEDRFLSIPKVVWSTSDSDLYRQTCLSRGAKAYLVKPSSINGISETARQMLAFCEV